MRDMRALWLTLLVGHYSALSHTFFFFFCFLSAAAAD